MVCGLPSGSRCSSTAAISPPCLHRCVCVCVHFELPFLPRELQHGLRASRCVAWGDATQVLDEIPVKACQAQHAAAHLALVSVGGLISLDGGCWQDISMYMLKLIRAGFSYMIGAVSCSLFRRLILSFEFLVECGPVTVEWDACQVAVDLVIRKVVHHQHIYTHSMTVSLCMCVCTEFADSTRLQPVCS